MEGIEDDHNRGHQGNRKGHHEGVVCQSRGLIDVLFDVSGDDDRDEDGVDHLGQDSFDGQTGLEVSCGVISLEFCQELHQN